MKISAALSILALGLAQAEIQQADQLEKTFERTLYHHDCCEWVCPDPEPEPEPEPDPCYYRSKGMMMSGSYYGGDDCYDYDYRSKGMMGSRRVKETPQQGERALPGKGWGPGPGYPPMPDYGCYWDCSGCGVGPGPGWPWPGPGHVCFPTVTTPDACDCTCCGVIPYPPMPDPEPEPEPEPEPCYYRSKAMMMGGSYCCGDECYYDYRSKGMMGSRRAKETPQQGERALPGKGWGPGWGGPSISCDCDCDIPDPPMPPRSKGMMKGSKKGGMMGGSYYDDDYY